MEKSTAHRLKGPRRIRRQVPVTAKAIGVGSVLLTIVVVFFSHSRGEASGQSPWTLPLSTSHGVVNSPNVSKLGQISRSPGGQRAPAQPTLLQTGGIVVDHNSVALFESIPETYLEAAASLSMLFVDRSVGMNIDEGLDCLSYPSNLDAPNNCNRYEHVDPRYSVDPSELTWSHPGGYDRSNWSFLGWSDTTCDSWFKKIDCYLDYISPRMHNYDVLSFQFSYLAVDQTSSIMDEPGGYFWDNPDRTDVFDQRAFEAQHPDKAFIYWTASLSRSIGTQVSEDFNAQMRQYAETNGIPLFDVADIESHDPAGNPCYDNRDGVAYDNGNGSENYPDDGINRPAICPQYTTEVDGGHLGSVSDGKIRVAKAFWVLMARIAGWDGTTGTHKLYFPLVIQSP